MAIRRATYGRACRQTKKGPRLLWAIINELWVTDWLKKLFLTWKDLMNVHSKVRIPSPLLRSLTSRITRNKRKKVMEMRALSSVFWRETDLSQVRLRGESVYGVNTEHQGCVLCGMNLDLYQMHMGNESSTASIFWEKVALRFEHRLIICMFGLKVLSYF